MEDFFPGLTVTIAGIELRLISEVPVDRRYLPSCYRGFLGRQFERRPAVSAEIRLKASPPPAGKGLTLVYAVEGSWALYKRDAENYLLDLPGPDGGEASLYQARMGRDPTAVTLYSAQALMGLGGEDENFRPVVNPLQWPLDEILLIYLLAHRSGAIIRSAGWLIGNRAYLVWEKAGAEGDAVAGLIAQHAGGRFLSDGAMVVRKTQQDLAVFGTPWCGPAGIAENASAPLAGLVCLEAGENDHVTVVSPAEALHRLMPLIRIPRDDPPVMTRILTFCETVVRSAPAYVAGFRSIGSLLGSLQNKIGSGQP